MVCVADGVWGHHKLSSITPATCLGYVVNPNHDVADLEHPVRCQRSIPWVWCLARDHNRHDAPISLFSPGLTRINAVDPCGNPCCMRLKVLSTSSSLWLTGSWGWARRAHSTGGEKMPWWMSGQSCSCLLRHRKHLHGHNPQLDDNNRRRFLAVGTF